MEYLADYDNTICAQASAAGPGAISIVRISGPESLEILGRVFRTVSGKSLKDTSGNKIVYGMITDPETSWTVDEVLVAVFRAPHSYTGEESAEVYCHGSDFIVQSILRLLIGQGARMARPGEFTQRAFLHGRMDLSQAEAVADLIASETRAAHDVAMHQLKGGISSELRAMRAEMVELVSLMELELDFSEEDVEFADRNTLRELLKRLMAHLRTLTDSFAYGNAIKNGVPVAIVGAVNTGKSTLLNALLGEERAIVSPVAGTTRDFIEDTLCIDGITFRFIDTAGLRDTLEAIERIGIERTYGKMRASSVVLLMLDCTRPSDFQGDIHEAASHLISENGPDDFGRKRQLIILLNKSDAAPADAAVLNRVSAAAEQEGLSPALILPISARTHDGLQELTSHLSASQKALRTSSAGAATVTNLRHYEALTSALKALDRVREGLDTSLSTELLTQDIREALYQIGTITGEVTPDEILGNIFSRFCIGK